MVGYDEAGLIVHDHYGEWFAAGYRTDLSGAYLHYSKGLIHRTCSPDGEFWVHFISWETRPRLQFPSGTLPFFFVLAAVFYLAVIDPAVRSLFFNVVFAATGSSMATMKLGYPTRKLEDRPSFKAER